MTGWFDRDAVVNDYTRAYQADYGFESVMVKARQQLILELLASKQPQVIVEVGCGSELLYERALDAGQSFAQWVIVEPSAQFADSARSAVRPTVPCMVIETYFEGAADEVLRTCVAPPDLVICSGLLHEVPNPAALLAAARNVLSGGSGLLHVNVPNALSLHRRLARLMGLVADEHDLTTRNLSLQQQRVFDLPELEHTVLAAGFRPMERGGYFLKPFTHQQMSSLSFLTPAILDGLWKLGQDLPELASEVFVNAELEP
jgi:SAM-dependent methyltransferase